MTTKDTPEAALRAQDFAYRVKLTGRRAEVVPATIVPWDTAPGVNIWADNNDRYPTETVWFEPDGAVWGDSFEHTVSGTDVPLSVGIVIETMVIR